ncbi:hypothetical protein D3C76_1387480 [compost metagenome]
MYPLLIAFCAPLSPNKADPSSAIASILNIKVPIIESPIIAAAIFFIFSPLILVDLLRICSNAISFFLSILSGIFISSSNMFSI